VRCWVGNNNDGERERAEQSCELRGRKTRTSKQGREERLVSLSLPPSPSPSLSLSGWSREEHEAGAEMSGAMEGNGSCSSSPSHGHYSCLHCTPLPSRTSSLATGTSTHPLPSFLLAHNQVALDHPDRREQERSTRGSNANPGISL
jgi:hypothetical protein